MSSTFERLPLLLEEDLECMTPEERENWAGNVKFLLTTVVSLLDRGLEREAGLKQLSEAICAFAEWQETSYGRDEHTINVVGDQLWSEVSDLVYQSIQRRPTPLS